MLIAVDVRLLLQLVPALPAHHPDILHLVAVRCAIRQSAVYVAGLVNRFTAHLASVIRHFKTEVALGTAVGVALSVLVDYPQWLAAYPYMEAEKFEFLCHKFYDCCVVQAEGVEPSCVAGLPMCQTLQTLAGSGISLRLQIVGFACL